MYDTLWQMISTQNYTLTDMTYKIDTFWAEGQITEEQRNELKEMAVNNITVEQEKPELETIVENLAARVTALESAVEALQGSSSESGSSETTYPEWTAWDGVSTNYQYGAIVSHNGQLWISTCNTQNVWEPGTTGTETLWSVYTEE